MARGEAGLVVPPRWLRRDGTGHGVLVHARAPVLPPSGVRPELVLTCAEVDDDLATWRDRALRELDGRLDDLAVEDDDTFELTGHDVAYHRFAHRLGAADVISEQWAWVVDGTGLTLTCSVAREDYGDWCDVFEAVAETVDPLLVSGQVSRQVSGR